MDTLTIDNGGEIISTTPASGDIPHDDETYGDSSPISLDYFREKVRDFQTALNSVDLAYRAGLDVYEISPSDRLAELLTDYESRAGTLKATAETLNAGAALVNAAGGRMPVLSIPSTLGLPQFVMPAVYIAALATAAYLISWAKDHTEYLRAAIDERAAQIDAQLTPQDKARVAAAQSSAASAAGAFSKGLDTLATIMKWGAIGIAAFLAWRAYKAAKSDD